MYFNIHETYNYQIFMSSKYLIIVFIVLKVSCKNILEAILFDIIREKH